MSVHGKLTGLVYGQHNITRLFSSIDVSRTAETTDATMFQAEGKEYVVGQTDSTASLSGRFDGDAQATKDWIDQIGNEEQGTLFAAAYGGWRPGFRVHVGSIMSSGWDVSSPVAGIVNTKGSLQFDGGVRSGQLLQGPLPITASVNGPAVDNGKASPRGGTIYLLTQENTRSGASVLTVQHSNDGSVWADVRVLPTVAAGTHPAGEYAVATPINRYVRVISALAAGTGNLAVTAVIVRNP